MSDYGWISIHRKIKNHRLWNENRPKTDFEAWFDLLVTATHRNQEVIMNRQTVLVKRGQILTSMKSLGERWQWSRGKVNRFLNNLEEHQEIIQKRTSKYTLLTIVNYDIYQDTRRTDEHQTDIKRTSNGHQTNTYNKNNNENKVNKGGNRGARQGSEKSSNLRLYI